MTGKVCLALVHRSHNGQMTDFGQERSLAWPAADSLRTLTTAGLNEGTWPCGDMIRYTERLAEAGIDPSVGSKGDS